MAFDPTKINWENVSVLGAESLTAPEPVKANPLTKVPEAKDWLVYKNQGAIRSQPLKNELVDAMSFLPELGVTMEVFSGGQPSHGVHGVDRTGSHRHDGGGSGDVFFYKDGRRLDWANEADLPIFTEIVRRARRNGVTGIGAGQGYMQPGSMHIGYGKEAVWGAGGKGANAPEWLRSAYNSYDQEAPASPVQAKAAPDVGQRIMSDMMRDFGLTREQAAAFAGNFDHESGGFKYLQEQDPQKAGSKGGLGFAMWTGPRRKRFEQYVAANNLDPASYEANYGFLKYEIENDPYEAQQFAKVKSAETIDEATRAVSENFLRPGVPHMDRRLERARAYFSEGSSQDVDMTSVEWDSVPIIEADGSITQPKPQVEAREQAGQPQEDSELQTYFSDLEKDAPGRYKVIPEDQYEAWKADWDAQNQSSGVVGDTKRLLNAGWAGLGLGVREAVNAIPGVGDDIVYALDSVDEWMNGQKSEAYLGGQIDKAVATLTPATREARGKHWWDEEKNRPGAAWSDPRSYFAGVVESLPSMAATMGPSLTLARGAYVSAIASGASQRVAAASAARTAMVAGAVSEGIIGGGQAALSVRQQIEQMPRQALEESAAVKQLMEGGMSIDEAVDAIADDAATQAFVIAGTATGVFGGFGDRVLAKIVADGVGGNIAQRIVQGAVREGVAEGVLEEAPQEALSQLGENVAMKNTVDPDRDLTEGVANAAAGGVAVGGAMGAGMGAGGAAMSPRTPDSGFTPDITPKKGVLVEAMDHGARETAAAAGSTFIINDPAFDDSPAGELNGVEVSLAPDQSGIAQGMRRVILPDGRTHVVGQRLLLPKEPVNMAPPQAEGETTASDVAAVSEDIPEGAPAAGTDVRIKLPDGAEIMARVEGYADGEAIVMDAGTGEVLQVPLSDIELSPAAAAEPVVVSKEQPSQPGEPIPEEIPGTEPIPQEQTTGELPPPSESAPVADVPYRTPQPGQRVIVAAEGIDRFPGTVQSYEDGAEEALIRRDDGSEVQVPVSDLRVSKLTDKQIEKQELKENPPIERETITDKEPTAREVVSKQVLLPDTKHARLYDLGKLRRDSKRTIGGGTLDMDSVSPGEQSRLADEFGVSAQRLGQIADDYRYRVERAAKGAKSRLPFKMWPVNEKMLGRMKDEDRKEAESETAFPVPEPMDEGTKVLENDWDKLPVAARKAVLTAAKVKRAPSTRWADFPANIRKKLEASLQVSTSDEAVPEVSPVKESAPAPVAPPSFEDFKAALPKDAEGFPDLTGVGSAVIGEVSGGATTAWNGLKTDDQRVKAIALANERTATKPKPADTLETAAQEAATSPANDRPEPTQAQKEAGNYKLGHVKLGGFDISIENPQGSERKGVDPNGKPWSVTMKSHYGYFKGTVGKDKDHIDTFIRPGTETLADTDPVFVIDQVNPDTKRFDEHKIMLGFKTRQAAERAYKENYAKGWKGLGTIVRTNVGELKDWFANGDTSKPFTKRGKPTDQTSATKSEKQPDLSTKDFSVEAFHGTNAVFDEFDPLKLGENTGAESASKGFFFSKSPDTAHAYLNDGDLIFFDDIGGIKEADFRKLPASVNRKIEQANKANNDADDARGRHDYDAAEYYSDVASRLLEEARSEAKDFLIEGSNIRPVSLRMRNPFEYDFKGKSYRERSYADLIDEAKSKGHDSVILRNTVDGGPVDDIYVVFDKENIRSKFERSTGSSQKTPAETNGGLKSDDVKSVLRSKEWKQVFGSTTNVNAGTDFYAHPESAVAFDQAAGWLDAKAGRPPREQKQFTPVHSSAFNPRNAYLEAYWGAKHSEARTVRASEAVDVQRELTDERPQPPSEGKSKRPEYELIPVRGEQDPIVGKLNELYQWLNDLTDADYQRLDDAWGGRVWKEVGVTVSPEKLLRFFKASLKKKTEADNSQKDVGKSAFASNKLFTEDKVVAARKRLRQKFGQINSGIDPEMLIDGMTIAGAYIESGVRKFPDYAKAMIKDLGPAVRPFLLSFYEGARNYPGLDTAGMDSVEDAKAAFDAMTGKPAAETKNDNAAASPRNVQSRPERKSPEPVPGDGASRGTIDLFGQPDQPVERERERSPQSSDRGGEKRSKPAVSGQRAESATGPEQQVPERGGNRDGTGSGTDRKPEPTRRNYRVTEGELTRKGSWLRTAQKNVQIVELIKRLENEGRAATADERALMVQFTGWGASEIANGVFPNRNGQYKDDTWKGLGERLKAALSDEDYKTAARSTQYAHYTSESVIRSIYDGLKRFGFAGGQVLEPGMGIGHFLGVMPANMAGTSQYTGIEFDGVTAAIAKHLYPDSRVTHGDYTKTKLPKGYFDLAIGNPPFAQTKITNDPEYRKYGFSLHDYFFAKTIDRVKPGGLMVFVTSRYTLDKVRDAGRRYLADRANLLGAIRLPQTAFQANAGTEVVTDVLFLQKRGPGIEDNGVSWTDTKEITVGENAFTVNEYIADHPEMVLGSHAATGTMYRKNDYTVSPDKSKDIEAAFAGAIENLPEAIYKPERGSEAEKAKVIEKDFDPKAKKEGGLYLSDGGELMIRQDGVGQAFTERQTSTGKLKPLSKKEAQFLKDFVSLRDAVKQTQFDQLTDGDWEKSLAAARKSYQDLVKRNGNILAYSTIERTDDEGNTQSYKRFKNEPLFMIDPDGPLAFTLEKITESGDIVEGAIFNGRVLNKPSDPEIVTTQDAMFVSLDKLGRFDLADVAKRAGRSEEETIADLATSIYEDPGDGWVLADEYLSGNVVQKLAEARAAADMDPKYTRNVDALLAVQPRPLGPTEIDVKLGAPWLPASDIEEFAREVIGKDMTITHNVKVGTWQVSGDKSTIGEFAMDNFPAADILNKILNNSQLRVTRSTVSPDGKKSTETDPEGTEKLNDIARKVKDRFRAWIWKDAARSKRLVNFYNDNYNNIAPRQFDGSHLTLPGTSLRFNLHPHQKRSIWRAIQTGDTYLAHAVGAGKTFEMIAIGMEERRLGLSKKPLFSVPNHMLGQFQREFLELYPAANIMVADEKNFHTSNRRKFIAQAALNDPDAIIITHSAFGRIGLSDETNDKQIQDLIDEWKELQEEIEAAEGKGLSFKRTQSQIERLEKRLQGKQKREAKDQVMTFEELGVDRLLIDELHEFRKLDFVTNQGSVKGIDPQGSQRAMDLYSKVTYLREKNPDPKRVLVGASGTPVTNTMGELFTVQRLFQPEVLEDIGAHNFDAWAAQFGDIVEGLEQNAAGKFETVSRFARFQNVPELMRRVRTFMDILTSNSLGQLVQRPTRINPPREIKTTPTPQGYKSYQDSLNSRINAIRQRKGPPKKGEDIILKVIADGRFSAIDMRFVHPEQASDPDSKLNQMLDDVIADYHATAGNEYVGASGEKDQLKGSTLVIFADIGLGDAVVKSRGFDMKGWIEKRFTDAGIPKDQFAFIRDHKAHAKKERLFADLREGRKRILIGGKDMETGVNVQKRLTHLYHLDAPWFPASVEQREGRADRQGNQNEDIVIRAYATKGSYDSTMWSMNARKARFIEQALNGDETVRKMEDVSEASAFEMAAALSSGDPRYLQLAGLRQEVERLGRLRKAHFDEQNRYKREEHYEESSIGRLKTSRTEHEAAIAKGHRIEAGKFSATVGKKSYDKRDDWAKELYAAFRNEAESGTVGKTTLGKIGGHDVDYYGDRYDDGSHKAELAIELPGDLPLLAVHPTAEDITVAGIGQRAVNQVNSIFEKPGELSIKIEQAERRLKQIRSQIGAPFPEESLFLEKQGELSELELELQSEKETAGPTEADKAGSVRDAVKARDEEATTDEGTDDVEVDPRFSKSMGQQGRSSDLRAELTKGQTGGFFEQLLNSGIVRIVETRPVDLPGDVQAWTDPDGTITLVAPAIAEGTGTAVLLHEALHAGRGALVERKVWQALEKRLASLYRQHNRSAGRAKEFFDAARDRVEAAGVQEKDRVEEFGAYAIEEYEKAPKILQRWVDDAIGAVKSWVLRRFGRQLGAITPAQLRALAISALKDRARPDPVSNQATGEPRGVMFSRKVDKAEVKDQIAGRWTDLSPKLLSLVPLNYFEEMKRPGMNAVTKYMKVKRFMDTYRSEKHEAMDKVAQDWRKFASRNRKGAAELASLMHDSTRMSVDPSITYEGKEPGGYFALKARFDALPPAARALYKTVRNSYVRMQKEMDQLILDNVDKAQKINEKEAKKRYDAAKQKLDRDRTIDDLERREKAEELAAKYKADMTKSRWAAKARLTRLRQTFEKNRVPAPYFPLARFGDYFVSVRDMAGDIVSFSRFESDTDRRRWLRANKAEIESEYPGVVFEQGVLGNSAAVRQAMDPRLVAEIDGILKDANVDAEVMDAIYQKWLQSMPDLSVRKRYIHRKGTTGFHQDALRAFASHMFHAGHQMGKLKYGIDLQEAVDDARDQAKGSDDPTRAGQLVNELSLRHEWVMNPKGSKFAQKVNSAAFVWYLAATPAAAIINMTQPILFGIPILGAKLGGVTKASAALMKASTDVMYGKGDIINGRLTSDEKRAIKDLYASGSIDRTMAMEIAGIGDSGVAYSPLRHAVMTKISWMFHRAEVVNREVTALAAYRMARAKGMSHEKAVDVAHELNFTVNYDYANSSRPRILQSDFAKVAGVFMSYQLNVWYRIFRDIHQTFAGDTPQARKEARYQLAGLMGVQTLIGGTSGFFGYNVLMALAGMFFDDDDDPFSFKHEAERAIYDLFGENVGGMIINGVPGHLTGVDLTSRIGMADFFLRMPEGSKEGKDWWLEFVAGSLGASVGAVGNAIVGMHYMSEGDTARGLELMAPKAIKDVMKAWRYNNEGLLTRKGDIILPRDDINAWNVIAQMSGFTPAKISMAHKLRGRKYEAQNRIKEERSALINRFATSIRNGDVDARKRVIEQIKAWNKRSYAKVLPITKETLERSLKTRARLSARREDGFLPINEKVGHYLSQRTPENPYR